MFYHKKYFFIPHDGGKDVLYNVVLFKLPGAAVSQGRSYSNYLSSCFETPPPSPVLW